jgi:DNA-binding response OmpR family regulator
VQQTDIARGIEAGADGYVAKPFSTHGLRERVHAVLGR